MELTDGKLYVVPTPVGNLGDMSPRAIEVLKGSSLILAEDTRTSATLMRHFGIDTPMVSHHKFNEHQTVGPVIERLKRGETFALVSDAGTPGISDPGFMLVRECRANGIEVETLPGPTAFVPALVNSGLPCERFTFEGFLPQKKGAPRAWNHSPPTNAHLLSMSRLCGWRAHSTTWRARAAKTAKPLCRAKSQNFTTPPATAHSPSCANTSP